MRHLVVLLAVFIGADPAWAHAAWERDALAAHNAFRAQVQVPPLAWDAELARQAAEWASELGRSARLVHSAGSARVGEGENLWIGTAGAFSVADAVGRWGAERSNFVRGVFPHVARAGSFESVAHYTQIIWRQTRRVGCGTARSGAWDVLVCRYAAPGNVIGQSAL